MRVRNFPISRDLVAPLAKTEKVEMLDSILTIKPIIKADQRNVKRFWNKWIFLPTFTEPANCDEFNLIRPSRGQFEVILTISVQLIGDQSQLKLERASTENPRTDISIILSVPETLSCWSARTSCVSSGTSCHARDFEKYFRELMVFVIFFSFGALAVDHWRRLLRWAIEH